MHEGIVHIPVSLDDLAQRGLDLVRGNLFGILVVGQIEKAAIRAHAAVRTDFKPGADTRLAGFIQCRLQRRTIHLQVVHFLVICFSTLIGQKR